MSQIVIRSFRQTDKEDFLKLQENAFRGLEYIPRVKIVLESLDPEGSLIAEQAGSVIGCVGLFSLDRPGWFEISKLAVRGQTPNDLPMQLVKKVLGSLDLKSPRFLKASTPSIQPYVDIYKNLGFEPVRRSVRICWDLSNIQARPAKIETKELEKESADEAADVWVEGLRPYWDYWIEESGGAEEVKAWTRQSVSNKTQMWLGAFIDGKLVGLAMVRPDSYGPGDARFNGAYAIPKFSRKRNRLRADERGDS